MSRPKSDTRVTELTPTGRAAVAVVLVEGPDATALVGACVHRADGRSLIDCAIGRIFVGHWGSQAGEELVVCRRGQDVVEIHCHGGKAAVEAVIERLLERGCRRTSWQQQIHETADDPICAAARIALAAAPTARTAAVLLDQFQGVLSRALREVVAAVESRDWSAAVTALEAMLSHRGVGLHLTRPWRVVLAGRPNVGKSSLLNALVGFERAIVCDMPGTTRDVVTAMTAIDGWPILLADTAGLRETRDEVESAGVAHATAAASDADLVMLVCDTLEANGADLPPNARVLRVLNKIDLHPALPATTSSRFDVCTSVVSGAGIAELVTAIGMAIVPAPPTAGEAVPFTGEQVAMLDAALDAARRQDAQAALDCLRPLLNR